MPPLFLPTRDLCSLRPLLLPSVAKSLYDLTEAACLGREAQVTLDCNEEEHQDDDDDDQLRTDEDEDGEVQSESSQDGAEEMIERRFAQTWLIKFISADISKLAVSASEAEELYTLQDQAGSILAALCGNSGKYCVKSCSSLYLAFGLTVLALVCRVNFSAASHLQTTRFILRHRNQTGDSMAVRIRDSPVTADALGNRTWGAAPLLSRRLVRDVLQDTQYCTNVLELGAGTGLVGLVVTAALRCSATASNCDRRIHLTDYHPHVLKTLQDNVRLNGFDQGDAGQVICHVARLDWQEVHEEQTKDEKVMQERYRSTAQTVPDTASAEEWPRIDSSAKYDLIIAAGEWPPDQHRHLLCILLISSLT